MPSAERLPAEYLQVTSRLADLMRAPRSLCSVVGHLAGRPVLSTAGRAVLIGDVPGWGADDGSGVRPGGGIAPGFDQAGHRGDGQHHPYDSQRHGGGGLRHPGSSP